MLLHYRGQSAAALRALRRAAEGKHWVAGEKRGNYLAHIVTIAALSNDLACAVETLTELDERPETWAVGAVRANVYRARGELLLAQGDCDEAQRLFRHAINALLDLDAPIDAAVVRLRLAACMAQAGDQDDAEIELLAARKPAGASPRPFLTCSCALTSKER
jgi:predicted negative regulator of RcsB-dependent stress response